MDSRPALRFTPLPTASPAGVPPYAAGPRRLPATTAFAMTGEVRIPAGDRRTRRRRRRADEPVTTYRLEGDSAAATLRGSASMPALPRLATAESRLPALQASLLRLGSPVRLAGAAASGKHAAGRGRARASASAAGDGGRKGERLSRRKREAVDWAALAERRRLSVDSLPTTEYVAFESSQPGRRSMSARLARFVEAEDDEFRLLRLAEWEDLRRAEAGERYSSAMLALELKLRQAVRLTEEVALPSELRTAVALDCLDRLAPHVPQYKPLLLSVRQQLCDAVYTFAAEASPSPASPSPASSVIAGESAYLSRTPYFVITRRLLAQLERMEEKCRALVESNESLKQKHEQKLQSHQKRGNMISLWKASALRSRAAKEKEELQKVVAAAHEKVEAFTRELGRKPDDPVAKLLEDMSALSEEDRREAVTKAFEFYEGLREHCLLELMEIIPAPHVMQLVTTFFRKEMRSHVQPLMLSLFSQLDLEERARAVKEMYLVSPDGDRAQLLHVLISAISMTEREELVEYLEADSSVVLSVVSRLPTVKQLFVKTLAAMKGEGLTMVGRIVDRSFTPSVEPAKDKAVRSDLLKGLSKKNKLALMRELMEDLGDSSLEAAKAFVLEKEPTFNQPAVTESRHRHRRRRRSKARKHRSRSPSSDHRDGKDKHPSPAPASPSAAAAASASASADSMAGVSATAASPTAASPTAVAPPSPIDVTAPPASPVAGGPASPSPSPTGDPPPLTPTIAETVIGEAETEEAGHSPTTHVASPTADDTDGGGGDGDAAGDAAGDADA